MTNKNSASLVKVSGETETLDHRPTLAEAQDMVKGYIEFVKARNSQSQGLVILVVNERGKPLGLPVNKTITTEYGQSIQGGYIVGDVIVLTGWRTVGN